MFGAQLSCFMICAMCGAFKIGYTPPVAGRQVEWELIEPRSGVVFKTAREGFGGNHMYTTYSHTAMDMDGPRCR